MWLVIIDAHSKWLEVFPMSSTMSTATVQCLREIFARFGLPERIVTDNAPNFVSSEFTYFLKQNGIRHTTSAPYHLATNGLAERAVRIFKDGMKKMSEGSLKQKLARFLFSYHRTPQSTTGVAPSELLMGTKLRSVLDLLNPTLNDRVDTAMAMQKDSHDKRAKQRSFKLGDIVYVRNYGQGPRWINGKIVDCSGPQNFKVTVTLHDQTFTWKRHIDQLRVCYSQQSNTSVSHSTDLNASDISLASHSTEEGEEEEESVIVIWPNTSTETSAAPVNVSATEPR